ncbi:hypothetical protein APSETT444_010404 [Aspergillus pseudonomiae]
MPDQIDLLGAGLRVGAVALVLEPVLQEIQVFVVGGAQTVQQDDWVRVLLRQFTVEVIDAEQCRRRGGEKGGQGKEGM